MTLEELQKTAENIDGDFITKKPVRIKSNVDFTRGQIGVITVDRPNQATQTLARYRYEGDNNWVPMS